MIISHEYKFIYFANGKCASSTIENSLAKYNDDDRIKIVELDYGKKGIWCKKKLNNKKHIKNLWGTNTEHVPPMLVKDELGEIFNDYFKFSFVRNPYSWVVSQYFWNFKESLPKLEVHHLEKLFEFLKKVRRGINGESKFQFSFLSDDHGNGDLLVDYVGKVENFTNDFDAICKQIGIANEKSENCNENKKKHYLSYFTKESKKFVEVKYAKDFKKFNYSF